MTKIISVIRKCIKSTLFISNIYKIIAEHH